MINDLDSLLDIIDAPEDLVGLMDVISNLPEILPFLPKIDPNQWSKLTIRSWIEICEDLLEDPGLLIHINNIYYKEKTIGSGLSNYKTSHPLYSALWTPTPKYNAHSYYHLQAHLINSNSNFKSAIRKEENLDSALYVSSLSIRNIGTKDSHATILLDIPSNAHTVRELHTRVSYLLENTEGKNPLIDIEKMLAYTLEDRTPYSKQRYDRKAHIESLKVELEEVDNESDIPSYRKKFFNTTILTTKEFTEARNEGNSDEENYTGQSKYTEDKEIDSKSGETPKTCARALKTKMRGLARYNQQLPMRWDRLNHYEVSSLYLNLHKLHKNSFKEIPIKYQDKLATLIVIMHWTASSFERASNVTILKSKNYIPDKFSEDKVYLCLKERLWVISPPNLNQRKIRSKWKGYLEESISSIQLPINALCWKLIQEYAEKTATGLNERRLLFKAKEANKLKSYLKEFISLTKAQYHSRLTQIRISSHIFDLLIDQTGDTADASIITGRIPNRGQKTALYYYSPLVNDLQKKYSETCKKVENTITDNITFNSISNEQENFAKTIKGIRTGSKICPLEKTILLMITDLQKQINYYKKKHLDESHIIKFHNAYTAYCVMMLGFATGYRAVRDPFYSESEIDEETGFLVISDKDSDDYYNSRIVWLPQVCRDQITRYSEYCLLLGERLVLTNLELAKRLLQPKEYNWSIQKKQGNELPLFFFLKDFHKTKPVRPVSVHEMMEWITDIPLNANRHYLRTHLREQGVSGEFVDSFMGHWEYGQEPFGQYSSLSPLTYIGSIKEPLEKLLDDAGWKVIKGIHG